MEEPGTETWESTYVTSSYRLRTTEHHRGWKRPWRSSSPTHAAQSRVSYNSSGFCSVRFKYHQGWRLHSLSGQALPMFDHPPTVQKRYRTQMFSFLCCCFPDTEDACARNNNLYSVDQEALFTRLGNLLVP